MTNPDPFTTYFQELQRNFSTGSAAKHTHCPALKAMLEAMGDGVRAINEPKRVKCGAPDYIITRAGTPVGYIEAKTEDLKRQPELAKSEKALGTLEREIPISNP